MIRILPPWKGNRAEDIWALYYFLLYRTLPFQPEDYLPKDSQGVYYYPNGDRTRQKVYPTKPFKTFALSRESKRILSAERLSTPNTLEDLIMLVSPKLHR